MGKIPEHLADKLSMALNYLLYLGFFAYFLFKLTVEHQKNYTQTEYLSYGIITFIVSLPMAKVTQWLRNNMNQNKSFPCLEKFYHWQGRALSDRQKEALLSKRKDGIELLVLLVFIAMNMVIISLFLDINIKK